MKYLLVSIFFISTLTAGLKNELQIVGSISCKTKQLDRTEIKEIFLKKKEYFNGELIIVLDNPNKIIYQKFINNYVDKTLREMKAYWMRMLFTGITIPPEKLQLTNLNKYNDNMCYISYLEKNNKLENWNVIQIR